MGEAAVYALMTEQRAALLDAAAAEAHRWAAALTTGVATASGWDGPAAGAFRHASAGLLSRLRGTADELAAAAAALRRHALTVRAEDAEREARARRALEQAQRRVRHGLTTALDPLGLLS
ncbi:hypothetical protein [Jatrophihabitans fulvus]